MNRECYGHYFTLGLDEFYRCLGDGGVVPTDRIHRNTCPRCKRRILSDKRATATAKYVLVVEVLMPNIGAGRVDGGQIRRGTRLYEAAVQAAGDAP